MRVAIIGGGVSGLASARRVKENGFECDVFENCDQIGGTWVYTNETKLDKFGYPILSAMYKGLRTNLPKEAMSFPGFPMPEKETSYIKQVETLEYINSFADHFNLIPLIKFNTIVTDVRPLENSSWEVTFLYKPTREVTTKIYDAVTVCNGHFSAPKVPKIMGSEHFTGDIFHSHSYRSADNYRGKRVLVIGGGPSGIDIAFQLSNITEHVVLSHHLPRSIPNIEEKCDVKCITNSGQVEFIDGTVGLFDAIILCTGYFYSFPFLHESCGISVDDNCVTPLYKHLINIEKPTMCFVGIPWNVCPFPLVDLQVRYFCKILDGSFKLPSKETMRKHTQWDLQRKRERGFPKKWSHRLGNDYEDEYSQDIAKEAQIMPLPRVISKLRTAGTENLLKSLATFRDHNFKIIDDETFEDIF